MAVIDWAKEVDIGISRVTSMKSIWKNQTSKTQKSYGGVQYINLKNNTQVSIGKWDYDRKPKNYQFNVSSPAEAMKGYPSQKLGITKAKALSELKRYIRTH